MKTVKFLPVLIVFFTAFTATNTQSVIKINPLGLAFGYIHAGYEKFINEKNSFRIGANFITRKIDDVRYTDQWVLGENLTFEAGIGPNFGIPFTDVDDDAFCTGVYPQISLALGYILK